jgi:hypothetical protein
VQSFIGYPEEERLLGRPRRRWKNVKIDPKVGSMWIGFMWLRVGTSGRLL